MTNFIQIDGKKIELTDEQVKQITEAGIIKKPNPFERGKNGDKYYYIGSESTLWTGYDYPSKNDDDRFKVANYCTDKKFMEQRALHETLSRLLWRFSMTHGGDEIDWRRSNIDKYYICYDHDTNSLEVYCNNISQDLNTIYFKSEKTADQAIEEIIKPFLIQHSEFVW